MTVGAAALQSDAAFTLYGVPKFISIYHVLLALLAIRVFALGDHLGETTGKLPAPTPMADDAIIERGFWWIK
jgi:hypothetical protein